jgi:hypothetical protein
LKTTIKWARNPVLDGQSGLLLDPIVDAIHCASCDRIQYNIGNVRVEVGGTVYIVPRQYIKDSS